MRYFAGLLCLATAVLSATDQNNFGDLDGFTYTEPRQRTPTHKCDFDLHNCQWKPSYAVNVAGGATATSQTGPSGDYSESGNGKYVSVDASDYRLYGTNTLARTFNKAGVPSRKQKYCLHFAYHMYGAEIATLSVFKTGPLQWTRWGEGDPTWETKIWTLSGNQGDQWYTGDTEFELTDAEFNVKFEMEVRPTATRGLGDIALDDVKLYTGGCTPIVGDQAFPGVDLKPDVMRTFSDDKVRTLATTNSGKLGRDNIWPQGVVPFKYGIGFSDAKKAAIRAAMYHIQDRTCVVFKERNAEAAYLTISGDKHGCTFEDNGYTGMETKLNIHDDCISEQYLLIHQLLHVLGFVHEHLRPDRDDNVRVNWANIRPQNKLLFERFAPEVVETHGVPYDFDSLLHFGNEDWQKAAGLKTIVKKGAENTPLGNRIGMSDLDSARVNKAYRCPPSQFSTQPPAKTQRTMKPSEAPVTPGPSNGEKRCPEKDVLISGSSGFIKPPLDVAGQYYDSAKCSWRIQVAEKHDIELTITDVDIEQSEGCAYDALIISGKYAAIAVERICGKIAKKVVEIKNNVVTITFSSDDSQSGSGFQVQWRAVSHSKPPVSPDFVCDFESTMCLLDDNSQTLPYMWRRHGGKSDPAGLTGPDAGNKQSNFYMFADSSFLMLQTTRASTPVKSRTRCVNFYYFMWGADAGKLIVSMKQSHAEKSIWELDGQVSVNNRQIWREVYANVPTEFEDNSQVSFAVKGAGGWRGDIAVDDVKISEKTCAEMMGGPTVTTTTAATKTTTAPTVPPTTWPTTGTRKYTQPPTKPDPVADGLMCDFDSNMCDFTTSEDTLGGWERKEGMSQTEGQSGPGADASNTGEGHYLNFDTTTLTKDSAAELHSGVLEGNAVKCVKFMYNMNGLEQGNLELWMYSKNGPSDQPPEHLYWFSYGQKGEDWLEAVANVDVSVDFQLKWVARSATAGMSNIGLDNISYSSYACQVEVTGEDLEGGSTHATIAEFCDFDRDFCSWQSYGLDRRRGTTPTSGTGPDGAFGGSGYYIYMEASNRVRGFRSTLTSEPISNANCVSFMYNMYGAGIGSLTAAVDGKDIWQQVGAKGKSWLRAQFPISGSGSSHVIGLTFTRGASLYGDIAVDNVKVFNTESCTELSGVEASNLNDGGVMMSSLNCTFGPNNIAGSDSMCGWTHAAEDKWTVSAIDNDDLKTSQDNNFVFIRSGELEPDHTHPESTSNTLDKVGAHHPFTPLIKKIGHKYDTPVAWFHRNGEVDDKVGEHIHASRRLVSPLISQLKYGCLTMKYRIDGWYKSQPDLFNVFVKTGDVERLIYSVSGDYNAIEGTKHWRQLKVDLIQKGAYQIVLELLEGFTWRGVLAVDVISLLDRDCEY